MSILKNLLSGFISKKFWTEGFGSLALAVLLALGVRWAFFEAYIIPSQSMLPTLLVNDHIFVNKFTYGLRWPFTEDWMFKWDDPQRADVIVFKYPKDKSIFYVKRVVGTPGDKVFFDSEGYIFVNGKRVDQFSASGDVKKEFSWLRSKDFSEGSDFKNYYHYKMEKVAEKEYPILVKEASYRRPGSFGPVTVPKGHYFVMGDNRGNSYDGRSWSSDYRFVPRSYVLGKASMVWLSCNSKLPVFSFLCNPVDLRWGRFFHFVY